MSQSPTEDRPEWQQPPFTPPAEDAPVVSGQVVVPGEQPAAPSVLESGISMVTGLIWPVMIFLGIFGRIPFMVAIFLAIVASIILGRLAKHLRQQRLAQLRGPRPPTDLR